MEPPPRSRLADITHRPRLVPSPALTSSRPPGFTYPPGGSMLEALFPHNPILCSIIGCITTPALLSLYCTSRTTRYYLHGHRRFFRNLLLIPDHEAETWEEKGKNGSRKMSAVSNQSLVWTTKLQSIEDRNSYHITYEEKTRIIKGRLWGFLKGDNILRWTFQTSELDFGVFESVKVKEPKRSFPTLMSRHLSALLTTIPVGRRLTTLVLDGTGVETEHMRVTLCQIEGTLRGLSVKHCPNLECSIWSDWLLNALEEARPVALQWLYIWGSGNTPTTDFDFTQQPLPLQPLDIHPDDPPDESDHWANPTPSLFAKMLPADFHLHNTLQLFPSMTCTFAERQSYMTSLRAVMAAQLQNYHSAHDKHSWVAPAFPLGEPHPLVALFALAKYLDITLDICYCVSRRDCFSFVYGRPVWENVNIPAPQSYTEASVVNTGTGETIPVLMSLSQYDNIGLHTHCVAEVAARREKGGTTCQNCGLWEDELSPEEFRGEGAMKEYAGIAWGTAIGLGRIALGSCCTDCVTEMTCYGCNSFYCPSCYFRSILTQFLPNNPLAVEPPGSKFLEWTCPLNLHGPHCRTCIESGEHFMTCTDCQHPVCIACHGPSGTTVSSALYTEDGWDSENEAERYGVVGDIGDWEEGSYCGWGGVRLKTPEPPKKTAPEDEGTETETEPETCLPTQSTPTQATPNFWGVPTTSDCYTSSSDYLDEMDPEYWRRDLNKLSSDRDTDPDEVPSLPDLPNQEEIPDIDESIFDTTVLNTHHDFDIRDPDQWTDRSWVARLNRMSETRIFEICARCDTGVCAGCLGYEDDMVEVGKEPEERWCNGEPEYRWCSGGCGKRFCESCLRHSGKGAVDLVCGGVRAKETDVPKTTMAGMPGCRPNGGRGGKGRCGRVMCQECQEVELMLRPTICQGIGEVESANRGVEGELETERRMRDRKGVWLCERCELGMEPLPY